MHRTLVGLATFSMAVAIILPAGRAAGQTPGAHDDNAKLQTVGTLPTAGPLENLCQADDGSIYVTGLEDKAVWRVRSDGRVETFANVPSVANVVGIAASSNGVVLTVFGKSFRRTAPAQPGSAAPPAQVTDFSDLAAAVLVLDGSGKVISTTPGEKGTAFNGITPAGNGVYLTADSNGGSVWRFDLATKRLDLWLKDDLIGSPSGVTGISANGIKVHDGWVYVSVSNRNAIYRVQMGTDGKPKGPVVKFAEGFRPDDFDFTKDGALFGSSGTTMYRVSPRGEVSKFLEDVPGAAATLVSRDSKWLYWPTRGGTMPQRLVRTAIP